VERPRDHAPALTKVTTLSNALGDPTSDVVLPRFHPARLNVHRHEEAPMLKSPNSRRNGPASFTLARQLPSASKTPPSAGLLTPRRLAASQFSAAVTSPGLAQNPAELEHCVSQVSLD
jgi:hypothetical protein